MPQINFFQYFPYFPSFYFFGWSGIFALAFILWSVFWKGWALWEAARDSSKGWFIAILLINTGGILEIAYLFFISSASFSNRERLRRVLSR